MFFAKRKMGAEEAPRLVSIAVREMPAHLLMLVPVYVLLEKNSKLISVKSPLDFFTREDLERLKSFEKFFAPDLSQRLSPFQTFAREIREKILAPPETEENHPSSFEMSQAVLVILAKLWGKGVVIEPYFVFAFTEELCQPLPVEWLKEARERDVLKFEAGLLQSGWAVFLALHLGYCELSFLNEIRKKTFQVSAGLISLNEVPYTYRELVSFCIQTIQDSANAPIQMKTLIQKGGKFSKKLKARIERMEKAFMSRDQELISVMGPKGLFDVV